MSNFVSVSEAKLYLGVPAAFTTDDTRIQIILDGIEGMVENHLETPIVEVAQTQKFRGGDRIWFTDARPIVSVTSIEDPFGSTIESDRYYLEEELGKIVFYSYVPRASAADGSSDRWLLTYVAGLVASSDKCPNPVRNAILIGMSDRYQRPESGIQSMRSQDSGVAYLPNPTNSIMTPEQTALLAPYVRRSV